MRTKIWQLLALLPFLALPAFGRQERPVADPKPVSWLKISDNGRYFLDRNGQPFFWQGDTDWELFHVYTASEARSLLKKRQSQGFNVVQVMATGVFAEASLKQGVMKTGLPRQAIQPWLNNDPLQPNETYFRRMDAIVKAAQQCGIVLVVGVYHAQDVDHGRINITNVGPWAAYLANRYKNAPNIVWSMYPHAKESSEPIVRAAITGLQDGDAGAHLITLHPDPAPTSSSFMHGEPRIAFNTLQSWSTEPTNYGMTRADCLLMPPKPVVDGEARYEGEDRTTAFQARRPGYWACMAGGFYSYGHGNNWLSPRTWTQWWDSPGARQMKIMGDLFRSLDWWNLVPDQNVLDNPGKTDVAARGAHGNWLLAYFIAPSVSPVNLAEITTASKVEVSWINPATGENLRMGTFSNTGVRAFALPAGWEDAVLLCKPAAQ
jgi:hypothetical protein